MEARKVPGDRVAALYPQPYLLPASLASPEKPGTTELEAAVAVNIPCPLAVCSDDFESMAR